MLASIHSAGSNKRANCDIASEHAANYACAAGKGSGAAMLRGYPVAQHPTPVRPAADWFEVFNCRMLDLPLFDEGCVNGQRERAPIN